MLKFRAWDRLDKKMFYADSPGRHHFILDLNGNFHNLQNGSGGTEYVVQQFTGFYDKFDQEIYVGDIVLVGRGPLEVKMTDGAFSFASLPIMMYDKAILEVVGHIFDGASWE